MVTNLEAAAVMAAQVAVLLVLNHLMLLVMQEMPLKDNNQVSQEMTVMETQVEHLAVVHYLTLLEAAEVLVLLVQVLDQVVVTTGQVMAVEVKM